VLAALVSLTSSSDAAACACPNQPLRERLDEADAAVIGRIVNRRETSLRGAPQTLLTVEVIQRVKGDVGREIVVRSPRSTDCDLAVPPSQGEDEDTGLLLTRSPDGATWLGSACSVVAPGPLVAEGGEPRGGPIKVVVGLVILALVLAWAFSRLKRGARPELPGRS
jgi:hypothetical protein